MGDANPIRTLGDYFKHSHEASNWLERLPAGSITTWEDYTTRFLTQFFPSEGSQNSATISLCSNNIKENLSQKHRLVSRTYSKSPSSWHRSLALN
ncbi:MAK10-like protein [Tanacetum coccineum]